MLKYTISYAVEQSTRHPKSMHKKSIRQGNEKRTKAEKCTNYEPSSKQMFGKARNFFEVVVPQKKKSGISSSIDWLTSMLGTAMASSVLPLFLLALGECCKYEFIVARWRWRRTHVPSGCVHCVAWETIEKSRWEEKSQVEVCWKKGDRGGLYRSEIWPLEI